MLENRYNFPKNKFLSWCFWDNCVAFLKGNTIILKYNSNNRLKIQQKTTIFKENEKVLIDGKEYTIEIKLISSPSKQLKINSKQKDFL